MTQTIAEQAFKLMDNIAILIDEAQHLDEKTLSKLQKMETKMTVFITEFHKHSALTAQEYTSYLNHVGDKVKVEVPDGTVVYKVRNIDMIPDEDEF